LERRDCAAQLHLVVRGVWRSATELRDEIVGRDENGTPAARTWIAFRGAISEHGRSIHCAPEYPKCTSGFNGDKAIYHAGMVDVTIAGDRAVFEVEGLDKLWALRSRLEIPLEHILGAEHDPDQVGRWWHGLKVMGTEMPGLFAFGTFYYHGELVFWDV